MDVSFKGKTPTIPEFFSGRSVFVTGATGFIGKVLLEKLLRSCPGIENIYVLVREKKGKMVSDRVNHILDEELFTPLKEKSPEVINKIVPIAGDVSKISLGLSEEDRNLIVDKVSVIFHVAASVRFDDPLKVAVLQNVRSTREVVLLMEEMKEVAVFVHVSTAYSNCDRKVIDERLYPPYVDWREIIQTVEEGDECVLQYLTEKYITPFPNTYTFSKSLAEHVVNDMCTGRFPAVILRPSIVVSSVAEPFPGWIDNFNGPYSLLICAGVGLLRTMYAKKTHLLDHVAVDNFIKSLLTATWTKAIEIDNTRETCIYNCCSEIKSSLSEYNSQGFLTEKKYPFEKKFWVATPHEIYTVHWSYYFINVILFQLLPSVLMDGLLMMFGKETRLLTIQRKLYISTMALIFFLTEEVIFITNNYNNLPNKLLEYDKPSFNPAVVEDNELYSEIVILGVKKYLLKERVPVTKGTLRIDKAMRIADKVLRYSVRAMLFYIIYCNRHIIQNQLERIYMYIENL